MKILLLEYITAGGLSSQPLPPSLLREGELMRNALLADFSMIKNVEILTTYDYRVGVAESGFQAIPIKENTDAFSIWSELLKTCDAALIVAPETDGILASLSRMVESSGVINLACKSLAVEIATNKYDTYQNLKSAGIFTISTYTVDEFLKLESKKNSAYVIKPLDGAGCENTFYFANQAAVSDWLEQHQNQWHKFVVQPYQMGTPASMSILCKDGDAWLLSCNQQTIKIANSEINYQGSVVNGLIQYQPLFTELAKRIAAAIPSLNGYVGVDVIVDNADVYVVEINSRITTSYIGLRESIGINPAQLILDLACCELSNSTFELPLNMMNKPVKICLNA